MVTDMEMFKNTLVQTVERKVGSEKDMEGASLLQSPNDGNRWRMGERPTVSRAVEKALP